ncbi:MAG: hypothetical protein E6G46_10565 [Actinobacteria bacterium]|nr:MAG: hypothetical protein E6G46_10565 [Actinomycetota bacterium]
MYSLTMAPPTARVYARIPMDLRDTPEEESFRLEVRAWLEANAPRPPHPARGSDESFEFGREWHRKLYDAGYAGMSWPPEHGGRGASPRGCRTTSGSSTSPRRSWRSARRTRRSGTSRRC